MSSVKTLTATGVAAETFAILYGISVTSLIPEPPPAGPLTVEVRNSSSADGSGDLIARLYLNANGQGVMDQVLFGDGVQCTKGIAVNVTANGHTDITVSIEFD
jgi:hypothetical protein